MNNNNSTNTNKKFESNTTKSKPKKGSQIRSKVASRNTVVESRRIDLSDQVKLYKSGPGKLQKASDIIRSIVQTSKSDEIKNFVINSGEFKRRVAKKVEDFTSSNTKHWFVVKDMEGNVPDLSPYHGKTDHVHDVTGFDDWLVLDNTTSSQYIMDHVTKKKRLLICAMLKQEPLMDEELIHSTASQTMASLPKLKPKQARGYKTNGISSSYSYFGTRLDPLGKAMFGDYVFKKNVSKDTEQAARNGVNSTALYMESKARAIIDKIAPCDSSYFENLSSTIDLPVLHSVFPQLAIGSNYISCCHIDHNIYYTALLACPNEFNSENTEQILQYFLFPEHKIVVPMRQGNVLLFNPMIAHCATNPLINSTHIYSAYVSRKVAVNTVKLQMED